MGRRPKKNFYLIAQKCFTTTEIVSNSKIYKPKSFGPKAGFFCLDAPKQSYYIKICLGKRIARGHKMPSRGGGKWNSRGRVIKNLKAGGTPLPPLLPTYEENLVYGSSCVLLAIKFEIHVCLNFCLLSSLRWRWFLFQIVVILLIARNLSDMMDVVVLDHLRCTFPTLQLCCYIRTVLMLQLFKISIHNGLLPLTHISNFILRSKLAL